MRQLHYYPSNASMAPHIVLEEIGAPFELVLVDREHDAHRSAAYLRLNPNGQIPVIVDRDGPGGKPLTLSQSTAILVYAAEKSGKFIPKDPAARAAMLQALMSASTDVTPIFGAYFLAARAKEPHPPTVQLLKDRVRGLFQVWDAALAKSKCCVGDEVTVADLSLYAGYARVKGAAPDAIEGMPNLARWGDMMAARPAIQRAMKF